MSKNSVKLWRGVNFDYRFDLQNRYSAGFSMFIPVQISPKQAKRWHCCTRRSRAGLSGSLGSPSGRLSNAPIRIEIGHLVYTLEVQTLRVSRRRGRIPHLMGEIFNRTQLFRHRSRPAVAHGLILCSPSTKNPKQSMKTDFGGRSAPIMGPAGPTWPRWRAPQCHGHALTGVDFRVLTGQTCTGDHPCRMGWPGGSSGCR